MLEIFILSITSFISTNIDDIIIDAFFFSTAVKYDIRNIVIGKYLGIGTLIVLSFIISIGLGFLPVQYIGYLGLIPIGLGIKEIIGNICEKNRDEQVAGLSKSTNILWNVYLVTIANGADNIGVYIPLFTGFSAVQYVIFLVIYALMVALWCFLGYKASKICFLNNKITMYKKIIVPVVYILLGIYIMI